MMTKHSLTDVVRSSIVRNSLISRGDNVCVCLSGGADSVSLLLSLGELSKEFQFNLSAIHINHNIRGEESDRDEKFCVELCKRLGIKITVCHVDVPALMLTSGKSLEETARDARYDAFARHKASSDLSVFATAHTASDNAETVLMNILRGTTVSGLAGIPVKRDYFIRPMLDVYRSDVEEYLASRGENFVTDSTNLINDCTRNIIRNDVIPMLRSVNPAVDRSVNRLSLLASEDDKLLDELAEKHIDDSISSLPLPLAFRVIKKKHKNFCGKGLSTEHIMSLIENSSVDNTVSLPYGVFARVCDGHISFFKALEKIVDTGVYDLNFGKNDFASGLTCLQLGEAVADADYTARIDMSSVRGKLRYRSRMTGDRLLNLGVDRLIKKEFINKKIPVELRDICPIIFDDEGIVCVPLIGVADRIYTNAEDAPFISVSFAERQGRPVEK